MSEGSERVECLRLNSPNAFRSVANYVIIWSLDSFPQGWSVCSSKPQLDGSAGQQAFAAVALGGKCVKSQRECDSRPGPLPIVFK